MENKKQKIKKEDLNLIIIDLLDLRFNRGGCDLLCDYVESKLKEDSVKIEINKTKGYGIVNGVKYDYSTDSKKNGIKEMVAKIITSGEERNLSGEDAVGVWLNHAVEFMGREMAEQIGRKIISKVEDKRDGLWALFCKGTDEKLLALNGIDIYKADEIMKRIVKNIKLIKFYEFIKINKFVW